MPLRQISLLFRQAPRTLARRDLRGFADVLFGMVAQERAFTCLITRDAELQRLNREFLGHDYPTDVLSFPSGESEGPLGDIAISADRAADQATEFGHSLEAEIKILMLHGVLHLMGMDHESDSGEMARGERRWRKKLGLPQALIERVNA
ncbi:MAG TPA: rRNA maturation RNase YbeY [Bryobacteraceae bacterium]|nr:rRNA maturation RNase YbeY [Bryobacteraceae bacterium]